MRWRPGLAEVDWLRAGFGERAGGVSAAFHEGGDSGGTLNLGWSDLDSQENVLENRSRWVGEVWGAARLPEAGTVALPELVTLAQVHSAETLVVNEGEEGDPRVGMGGRTRLRGDGLMTAQTGLLLGVQTADCVPVLVADLRRRAVAAFHAGWRGTAGRIVERGVEQMRREFGSRTEDMAAAVGPAIARCCYVVGEEIRERFVAEFRYGSELFVRRPETPRWERAARMGRVRAAHDREERLFLDLHESNRRQLCEAGIPPEQITLYGDACTACSRTEDGARRFFSYRAERGQTGRMMSGIGLAGEA